MTRIRLPFRQFAWLYLAVVVLNACGGGHSSGSVPAPSPSPTTKRVAPSPSASPTSGPTSTPDPAAFVCPSSDSASSSAVASRGAAGESLARIRVHHAPKTAETAGSTSLVAVAYDAATASTRKATLSARESTLGTVVRQYNFTHTRQVMHVLKVPTGRVAAVEAALRAQPGVRSVGLTGQRRYALSVSTPYYPNDPYFTGFKNTVPPTPSATAPPATYETTLSENSSVPGQWDMHAIQLESAFGYSQANNGSGITNPGALGSSSVKLAVIDTGEDINHPELASKIKYQKCFITNLTGTQTTSNYTLDPQGHGTDVAGIAGEDTGNGFGFAAAGGNVELWAYRVFPTPDDNCTNDNSSDEQCGTDTADIASAIEDAITQKVNVISMSLGGDACTTAGVDPDTTEGAAVADAIAANIVVVAAAGNSGTEGVNAPGCDTGVIAVGATGLADGTTNGTNSNGSATSPTEYVASYTDYGSPGAAVNSSSAWGIVAPGGDPSGDNDLDDLHWIENIWTTTPYMANGNDTSFEGSCAGDYPTQSGTVDCRVLIAGTSMATPHVAGAAALIISVNSGYQSPTQMKQLLCQTADDISDSNEGCGRLNVYRAMASALGDGTPPTPRPIP